MGLVKENKKKVIEDYKLHDRDTGSASVQIALLTERINSLAGHFKTHKKDHHSRQGLLRLVNQRRKLISFLKGEDKTKYEELVKKLKLRK